MIKSKQLRTYLLLWSTQRFPPWAAGHDQLRAGPVALSPQRLGPRHRAFVRLFLRALCGHEHFCRLR